MVILYSIKDKIAIFAEISIIKDMDAIIRQSYLDKIEKFLGKDFIIILTGQRRVGKSYILRMFKNKVQTDEQTNIIFIDKEKNDYDNIKTYQDLNAHIDERYKENKINYILIDEVQDIKDFEKSLRSYYEIPNIEIIITGSNSMMLSSDLSSRIGGRYKEIYVQALSYEEFMLFHQLPDSDDTLALYIQYGGLPGLLKIGLDEQDEKKKKKDVYNTVLLKDVIMRNSIRNIPFLENLVRFLSDNTGKIFSANSISKYMVSQGHKVYVQVSYIIADEATRKREFGNLRDIKDNYPKYVISTTPLLTQNDENGITHLHLRKFLTQGL